MKWALTEEAFAKLLQCLDEDIEQAGEKYEMLRRKLSRFFEWKGALHPEELTDETFNRVARKLVEGVEIKDLNAYCFQVARFVLRESFQHPDHKTDQWEDNVPEPTVSTAPLELDEDEQRLLCLGNCLRTISAENRILVLEFYDYEKGAKTDHRISLAERLGIQRNTMWKRAQRIRDELEKCTKTCLRKKFGHGF